MGIRSAGQPWHGGLGAKGTANATSWRSDAAAAVTLRAVVGSRLLVWVAGLIALAMFGTAGNNWLLDGPRLTEPFASAASNFLVAPAARWDSVWYLAIAHVGYYTPPTTAMFPLYPMLIRVGDLLGSPLVIGALVSVLSMTAGLYLLHRLAELDLGEAGARATVMLVAFFPVAFFLSAVYTESLYLLLSVGAIYAARLERWAWAGALGGLATATRSNGILILVPLVLLYLYGPRRNAPATLPGTWWRPRYPVSRSLAWLTLVPLGLIVYLAYLGVAHSDALAPYHAQAYWGRQFAAPFGAIAQAVTSVPDDLHRVVTGSTISVGPGDPISWTTHNLIDLGFVAFALAGLAVAWRRLPFAYVVYAVLMLAHASSFPTRAEPLASLSRYELVIFPLFMGLGAWLAERRRLPRIAVGLSAALLAGFSGLWATWAWIA
jgi:hypothetical protein